MDTLESGSNSSDQLFEQIQNVHRNYTKTCFNTLTLTDFYTETFMLARWHAGTLEST